MTPSLSVSSGSPTSSSASTDILVPRPEHSGQAPNGALNEKVRGSISVSWIGWSFGQESFSLKVRQAAGPSRSTKLIVHEPVGEAERGLERVGEPGEQVVGGDETVDDDRDVVLDCFLSIGGSLSWISSPSTIARE